jgi:hypothetical protein
VKGRDVSVCARCGGNVGASRDRLWPTCECMRPLAGVWMLNPFSLKFEPMNGDTRAPELRVMRPRIASRRFEAEVPTMVSVETVSLCPQYLAHGDWRALVYVGPKSEARFVETAALLFMAMRLIDWIARSASR